MFFTHKNRLNNSYTTKISNVLNNRRHDQLFHLLSLLSTVSYIHNTRFLLDRSCPPCEFIHFFRALTRENFVPINSNVMTEQVLFCFSRQFIHPSIFLGNTCCHGSDEYFIKIIIFTSSQSSSTELIYSRIHFHKPAIAIFQTLNMWFIYMWWW